MTETVMPELTGNLKRNAAYYRPTWLPDGYPGRQDGDQVWAHPLYGVYALKDYLEQHALRPSQELRDAIHRVAHAAVARMEPHEGALVFWYEETGDVSRAVERHYSGLTQGYYAHQLAQAARVLDNHSLAEAADRAFAALTVPVERQGVLAPGVLGPSIAEIAQVPNSYILNGWQSALAAILDYAELTESVAARELATASAQEMARLLPLYDAPALKNSRYGLTGFVYARLVFRGTEPGDVSIRHVEVEIPGEVSLPVAQVGGRRWQNHVLPQDVEEAAGEEYTPASNVLRMNLVLSRISFPQVNRLLFEVTSPGTSVEVQLHCGRYDPKTAAQVESEWVTVARVDCPDGAAEVDVPLPWDVADLVVYPTNFAKVIDGNPTNVYHMIHIDRLRRLGSATGVRGFHEWADTWLRYIGEWRTMPIYDGLYVRGGKGTIPVAEAGRKMAASTARKAGGRRVRAD